MKTLLHSPKPLPESWRGHRVPRLGHETTVEGSSLQSPPSPAWCRPQAEYHTHHFDGMETSLGASIPGLQVKIPSLPHRRVQRTIPNERLDVVGAWTQGFRPRKVAFRRLLHNKRLGTLHVLVVVGSRTRTGLLRQFAASRGGRTRAELDAALEPPVARHGEVPQLIRTGSWALRLGNRCNTTCGCGAPPEPRS